MICFHKYTVIKSDGCYEYKQCVKCNHRKVVRVVMNGYSPVDTSWIETGVFKTYSSTPPN